ncbi:hypothetical protein ACS5PN_03650 [Roseateles sp. NT4]|uniref:hypothetical protein n=1 Tax=Roseateles sp. NT4 TaxID=3453715 RepID=UPI003EE93B38
MPTVLLNNVGVQRCLHAQQCVASVSLAIVETQQDFIVREGLLGDVDLQTPQGPIVPAGQNLAPLFNIVGSEMDSGKVRTTYGWVVGGSLVVPPGKTTVTAVARVTDNAGNSGSTTSTFGISPVVKVKI